MTDTPAITIQDRWPAQHSDRIQLYSLATPNGVKIPIALEELGLPYETHKISFADNDQFTPEFLSLNPNNKIPAIVDPNGPNGEPFGLWESGAILIYLAEKAGNLLPTDPARRYETINWVMFQIGGVGPMFGQFGHFHKFAADKVSDPYPRQRYLDESKRILNVLEQRLEGREWIMGDEYTIADIAIFPWLWAVREFYGAAEDLGFADLPNTMAWLERCMARPASEIGLKTPE